MLIYFFFSSNLNSAVSCSCSARKQSDRLDNRRGNGRPNKAVSRDLSTGRGPVSRRSHKRLRRERKNRGHRLFSPQRRSGPVRCVLRILKPRGGPESCTTMRLMSDGSTLSFSRMASTYASRGRVSRPSRPQITRVFFSFFPARFTHSENSESEELEEKPERAGRH